MTTEQPNKALLGVTSKAKTLTITADCGGSNSDRTRLWKTELQRLADHTRLIIRVMQQMQNVELAGEQFHPKWNYTITPRQ
jgi:DDE family transposase